MWAWALRRGRPPEPGEVDKSLKDREGREARGRVLVLALPHKLLCLHWYQHFLNFLLFSIWGRGPKEGCPAVSPPGIRIQQGSEGSPCEPRRGRPRPQKVSAKTAGMASSSCWLPVLCHCIKEGFLCAVFLMLWHLGPHWPERDLFQGYPILRDHNRFSQEHTFICKPTSPAPTLRTTSSIWLFFLCPITQGQVPDN